MTNNKGSSSISLDDRVRGALWGGLVGDAFCLGCHWIYSQKEIAQRFPAGIRGFETPNPEHYHFGKKTGDFTHYGDAALLMLSSVAECGYFDVADFGARFIGFMIDENYTGYRDHATKGTIANYRAHLDHCPDKPFDYQQGADDDQPATVSRLAPVVVAHMKTKDLLKTVAKATRVCQNNSRAIVFTQASALILHNLLNGMTPETAVTETLHIMKSPDKDWIEVNNRITIAREANVLSVNDATMVFGQSCPLHSSFTAALHTMLTCSDDYTKAIQATANAGGDSAGRAAMVGAWLGAYLGINAIPESWRTRLRTHDQIETNVDRIIAGMLRR
ncbi:MAG: ADP-ribosylglycohydrolase family protein [Desulfuromonadaceae bacterium]|nr:ADP-ribosylglycohydrolase family protein [Desulfuromonadaceae bacterium]